MILKGWIEEIPEDAFTEPYRIGVEYRIEVPAILLKNATLLEYIMHGIFLKNNWSLYGTFSEIDFVNPANVTGRSGHGPNDSIFFQCNEIIDRATAMKLQTRLGYPTGGYGFYDFTVVEETEVTLWSCQASSD